MQRTDLLLQAVDFVTWLITRFMSCAVSRKALLFHKGASSKLEGGEKKARKEKGKGQRASIKFPETKIFKWKRNTIWPPMFQRTQDSYICYSQIARAALLPLLQTSRQQLPDSVFKNTENDVETLQQ